MTGFGPGPVGALDLRSAWPCAKYRQGAAGLGRARLPAGPGGIRNVAGGWRGRRRGPKVELLEHIVGGLNELGALPYQAMAAFGKRRVDRSRNRKYLTALIGGKPRGAKRIAVERCLDDQHP